MLLPVDYNTEEKTGNDVEWQNMYGVCQNKGGGGVQPVPAFPVIQVSQGRD